MDIIRLDEASDRQRELAAILLVEAFRHAPSDWADLESARAEVGRFLEPDRLGFIAVDSNEVFGWIGAIKHSEHLWELHPLAVHPGHQQRGIGTLLIRTLEKEALRQGVCTIWLGTDDDFGGTSIFGADLYPNILERLMQLQPVLKHPYVFYQKMGYIVVGVIPDAGGFGKHDILMAKRITCH